MSFYVIESNEALDIIEELFVMRSDNIHLNSEISFVKDRKPSTGTLVYKGDIQSCQNVLDTYNANDMCQIECPSELTVIHNHNLNNELTIE